MFTGPLVVEGDVLDLRDDETLRKAFGLTETLCRFTMNGEVGYGVFEFLCLGPYQPLGLE